MSLARIPRLPDEDRAGSKPPALTRASFLERGVIPAADRVLQLQHAAGNRAVRNALRAWTAQRQQGSTQQDRTGGTPGTDRPAASANLELEALLAQIEAAMPSPERVAPYEAITATTAAQFSEGELDTAVERLWRRERLEFTTAARRAVATAPRGQGAAGSASARLQPNRQYQLRRSVSLLAANYRRGGGDLGQVADLLRRGSPYRRALEAEFERPVTIADPTAAQMDQGIFDAILQMWTDLDPEQVGELVVTFSGHGGGGSIMGVDGAFLGADRMESLANLAADHNVHLVYILDTCRAGMVVEWAQAATVRDIESRIGNVEEDRRGPLSARLGFLKGLLRATIDVGVKAHDVGDAARQLTRRSTTEHQLGYFQALLALSQSASAFGQVIGGADVPRGFSRLDALRELQQALGFSALTGTAGGPGEVGSTLRDAALLLDAANDGLSAAFVALDGDVRAVQAPQGGQAAAATAR